MKTIEQFDIALRIAGFNFKKEGVELVLSLFELTKRKGGDTTLEDVEQIIAKNDQKYKVKK